MNRNLIMLCLLITLITPTTASAWTPGQIRGLISRSLTAKGNSPAEVHAAIKLCKRESGFRPTAINGSCKGLFQLKTRYGRERWSRPGWNIWKANKYVHSRYGSWRKALAHSYAKGWY